MLIRVCIAKIHRATVTEADLNYIGSITIDEELIEKCGMRPFQYVNITNLANGVFWQTYVIPGPRGNGDICLNGPPAHHFHAGDKVIILAEGWIEPSELKDIDPIVVFVDDKNKITEVKKHKAIPVVTKWFERPQSYSQLEKKTGVSILYIPQQDDGVIVRMMVDAVPAIEAAFSQDATDQAHILYAEATEIFNARTKMNEDRSTILKTLETLFALFRGEQISIAAAPVAAREPSSNFVPNPGKKIEITVDGSIYLRLPVKTRLITADDTDIMPLIEAYVSPYLKPDDMIFVSEKALSITQNRIVDFNDIHPTRFARFLGRHVGNSYGSSNFHGFGHGTAIAMQLLIEESGYPRAFFAAAVAAITRPLGIRGAFYYLVGKSAKSIDCPMSFTIIEYAHAAKLAPSNPAGVARMIKERTGHEAVIIDANYRGAFSLGKSTNTISEEFIGELFRDNPLGQSDEMTPFAIVRRK